MAKQIPDRKRKQIAADYAVCGSLRQVAQKYGVSPNSVKNIVKKDEFAQVCREKKDEIDADIFRHMEGRRDQVCLIIDRYLEALLDESRIANATPAQLTTAMGTLIDKFTMAKTVTENSGGVVEIPAVLPEVPHE